MTNKISWLVLGGLLAAAGCASEAEPSDEQIESAHASRVQIALSATPESGRILYTLRNNAEQPVHVLSWELPNGRARTFSVSKNGEPVPFFGAWGKRAGEPSAEDYIELAPGDEIAEEVDLASEFDLAAGGHFDVANNVLPETLIAEHERVEVDVAGTLSIDVEPTASADLPAVRVRQDALVTHDGSCNFAQLLFASQAETFARNVSHDTWLRIQNGTWKGVNFRNWFGTAPSFGRLQSDNRVKSILTGVEAFLQGGRNYAITCQTPSCDPGVAAKAQALPDGTPLLRFCPPYFQMPLGGPEGAGAAFLHEMSHLAGAWGPETYGIIPASQLAINKPKVARENASNYQYYFLSVTP